MDYTNYKILKYYYSHGVAEMSELLWDKMTPEEFEDTIQKQFDIFKAFLKYTS